MNFPFRVGLKNKHNLVTVVTFAWFFEDTGGIYYCSPKEYHPVPAIMPQTLGEAPPPRQLLTILLIRPLYSLSLVRREKNGTRLRQDALFVEIIFSSLIIFRFLRRSQKITSANGNGRKRKTERASRYYSRPGSETKCFNSPCTFKYAARAVTILLE